MPSPLAGTATSSARLTPLPPTTPHPSLSYRIPRDTSWGIMGVDKTCRPGVSVSLSIQMVERDFEAGRPLHVINRYR